MTHPQKRILNRLMIAAACGVLLSLEACGKGERAAPPPPVVEVVEVLQKDVPVQREWIGTTDGLVNAAIRPLVTGYLIKQYYKEGDYVRKGQILFAIDPRPFRAALRQATGSLGQLEAQYENTRATLARVQPLAEENAVSKKDLDDAVGAERSAAAAVRTARAAVENAKLNLGFTRITSLIDGVAGLAKQQVGDLVGPNQANELTTVSTVHPIKVYYNENEQAYIQSMKRFALRGGAPNAHWLKMQMILPDGTLYPYEGKFHAIDRQVDPRTGTLRIAVLFPNPQGLLRPGQFVRVLVTVGIKKGALLVPQRAVTELQESYEAAVVGPGNRIEIRQVKPAERIGDLWVIDAGLKPGERVVAEGVQKVRQGMAVNPQPFISPVPPDRQGRQKPGTSGLSGKGS